MKFNQFVAYLIQTLKYCLARKNIKYNTIFSHLFVPFCSFHAFLLICQFLFYLISLFQCFFFELFCFVFLRLYFFTCFSFCANVFHQMFAVFIVIFFLLQHFLCLLFSYLIVRNRVRVVANSMNKTTAYCSLF